MKKMILLILPLFLFFSLPFAQAAFVEFPVENPPAQEATEISYFSDVASIFSFVLALVFILSLFGFLLSGITFVVAGGHEGKLGEARTYLVFSTVGTTISLIGYISLNLLKHFF